MPSDYAHDWTDKQIDELKSHMATMYQQAAAEMAKKLAKRMAGYESQRQEWEEKVASGDKTQEEFDEWRKAESQQLGPISEMADTLAYDAAHVDELANDLINDVVPKVYAENANYAAYGIETEIGYDTHSFALVNEDAVRKLMADPDGPLLPRAKVDQQKDKDWNGRKLTTAVTQSILQGESVPNAAKRLTEVLGMDMRAAVRNARTALTAAENLGRLDTFRRATELGIDTQKQWMATLDLRTRHTHRLLDKQHVPYDKPFKVEGMPIMCPGDPTAKPELVYNCRCRLVHWIAGIEAEDPERWSRLPKGMTYDDWKGVKEDEQEKQQASDDNAPTIAGVKKGKPMTFERANGLRGNPNRAMDKKAEEAYFAKNAEKNEALRKYRDSDSDADYEEYQRLREEVEEARQAMLRAKDEVYQYTVNCQTCVVANEARRRGYDVQATGNPENGSSYNERLARDSGLAWIDPETGGHPKEVRYDGKGREDALGRIIPTKASYWKWLNEDGRINVGERYTISFEWKGRARYGHIISMERTDDGIRFYDPQNGKSFVGEAAKEYAGAWKYQRTRNGWTYSTSPRIMRVDNLDFDYDFVSKILVKADE